MKLLPLHDLGAREVSPGVMEFGLLLPWISPDKGYQLSVKVIHEKDQFLQEMQPLEFAMEHSAVPEYGDYWQTKIEIGTASAITPESAWGTSGRYVYRYHLHTPKIPGGLDWIIDPFAREFGIGKLSAFTLGYEAYEWSHHESCWKTPPLDDLIMYELMINEFAGGIDRTVTRLDYLADLGINCIEIMPVSNIPNPVDWGFAPIGYFGVDERFGKRRDMQKLIDEAHQRNIAVILDVVYGHTDGNFPYHYVYKNLGFHENPFMGTFAKDYFGESTDFRKTFTQDFFFTVNQHWLECYHTDGFRYDCVPNYWNGPLGQGYANLVYNTYQMVKSKAGIGSHWQRFFGDGTINFIQCAEQLEGPREVLEKTYSNCTWQNETLSAAKEVAWKKQNSLVNLGSRFGLHGYPGEVTNGDDAIQKTALQYIENHDHSRFVCNFQTKSSDNDLLTEGDRDLWYKVQPYLIGMFTAKGIPMLWQGQEFGENYWLPDEGWGRVKMFRPVRWDYFYDSIGKNTISLVRKLIKLRRGNPQFRSGDHFFYNHHDHYQSRNVMLFSRSHGDRFSLVALNFGEHDQTVPFSLPFSGDYQEELHKHDNLSGIIAGQESWLTIPSNYGRIWTSEK